MYQSTSTVRAIFRATRTTAAFEEWFRADGDRLIAAAEHLGGANWKARASAIVTAANQGIHSVELVRDLSDLSQLLALELTDYIDSEEASCFLLVHSDDPRADDARLCCEVVRRGLGAMACCRFRGHEDKIVTKETEIGHGKTEVHEGVQV